MIEHRLVIANVMARRAGLVERDVAQVRRFDRLYERRINEQQARALIHEASWAEMLVIEELGRVSDGRSAAWLIGRLDFDDGYLCRILKGLCLRRLARCVPSSQDRRVREYGLTSDGRELCQWIETFHRREALSMLDLLPARDRRRLIRAMSTIEKVLARHPLPEFSEPWSSRLRKRARYRPRR